MKKALFALLFLPITFGASAAHAQRTYIIEESTDFTGNGCENTNLNTITASIREALDDTQWTGRRFTENLAWPQGFMDPSAPSGSGGLDGAFGDTAVLAVYAGHGNVNSAQFGFQRNSQCTVDLSTQMRRER